MPVNSTPNVGGNTGPIPVVDWIRSQFAGPQPNLDLKTILEDMNKDGVIKEIEQGKTVLLKADIEGLSEKGQKAMTIVQRAFMTLGLIQIDKSKKFWWGKFNWGLYGASTTTAMATLQAAAGIDPANGSKFGAQTLKALKTALEAKAKGQDWRAAVRPKK